MGNEATTRQSHLFTVRVWQEVIDEEDCEWRGKIFHVESNQTRYFRDWAALIPVLLSMMREAGQSAPHSFPTIVSGTCATPPDGCE
jgi:hypothetical protein